MTIRQVQRYLLQPCTSRDNSAYPVVFFSRAGCKAVLLWVEGGKGKKDHFLKDAEQNIIAENSISDIRTRFPNFPKGARLRNGIKCDLRKFISTLHAISDTSACEQSACGIMLDAWNLIEDLAYTLNAPSLPEIRRDKLVDNVYKKILFGNNLPSITPKGRKYRPLFNSEEIKKLHRIFRALFFDIYRSAPTKLGVVFRDVYELGNKSAKKRKPK